MAFTVVSLLNSHRPPAPISDQHHKLPSLPNFVVISTDFAPELGTRGRGGAGPVVFRLQSAHRERCNSERLTLRPNETKSESIEVAANHPMRTMFSWNDD